MTDINYSDMTMRKPVILLLSVALLCACSGRSYFPQDVQSADVDIIRFDSAMLALPADSAEMTGSVAEMYAAYPEMMEMFAQDIIGVDMHDTASLCGALAKFLSDTIYGFAATNRFEQEVFADISDIRRELNSGFGRILWLYSDFVVPDIYLIVSGFNTSLFTWNDMVVVGADMYLGSDYPYYNRVVYDYQKKTMRKECIPADVLSSCLFRYIPYTSTQSRLLDNMLYRGKIMYLLSCLLPEEKPWEIMGYTKDEWRWCERNESAIWRLMLDKQDLFRTESTLLTSYLNDGPFTSEISQDSPARLGTWIGWRIAEQYMKHNEDVSLQQLMAEPDAQKILELSHYKP